ncbi:MAG: alpha-glucuronidase, partial [Paraprevotella clara]|nr:alpha-glucuronidase [Paraprevotella clara]
MKNIRLTVWIGMMCGCLAAGMLQAGTRPDNACPAEEDGSRLWLPVMRPAEGAEVEVIYKGKVSPTIAIAIAELKNAWKGEPVLLEKKRTGQGDGFA